MNEKANTKNDADKDVEYVLHKEELFPLIGGGTSHPTSEVRRGEELDEVSSFKDDDGGQMGAFALQTATIFNSTKVAEALLKRGADIHMEKENLLQLAAVCKNQEMAELLLKHGADAEEAVQGLREAGEKNAVRFVLNLRRGLALRGRRRSQKHSGQTNKRKPQVTTSRRRMREGQRKTGREVTSAQADRF
jgi:hypothetical protein